MDNCLFCKIVAGEIPSRKVYEDDHAFAFLDINPMKRGHTLVVPRRHVDDFLESPQALTEIAPAIEKVATLLSEKLDCQGMNMFSSANAVAGQEIPHLHVHLLPRYAEQPGLRAVFDRDPSAAEDLDGLLAKILR